MSLTMTIRIPPAQAAGLSMDREQTHATRPTLIHGHGELRRKPIHGKMLYYERQRHEARLRFSGMNQKEGNSP
jgi:hypothetical protein